MNSQRGLQMLLQAADAVRRAADAELLGDSVHHRESSRELHAVGELFRAEAQAQLRRANELDARAVR